MQPVAARVGRDGYDVDLSTRTTVRAVVEALPDPRASELERAAREAGFAIGHAVREAEGLCARCGREAA